MGEYKSRGLAGAGGAEAAEWGSWPGDRAPSPGRAADDWPLMTVRSYLLHPSGCWPGPRSASCAGRPGGGPPCRQAIGQPTPRRYRLGVSTAQCRAYLAQRKGPVMEYRHLGRSGLQVSVLSFGSWVTFGGQIGTETAVECLSAAREGGVNFFDNAESYAQGQSERIMGKALAELDWPRYSFVISTKVFWGIYDDINMRNTTNRKYLLQAIDGSLERLGLDFVDILYCHRSDPGTPIEETVWAMSDIVSRGKALYWGTSEWPADDIRAAWEIADRHHLRKPLAEQPQYNLLTRQRVEREYARLYEDIGLGLTIWSPLASGLLTGKYMDGAPAGSRALLPGYEWLRDRLTEEAANAKVLQVKEVADDLGCDMAQLALAWCVRNPRVSTVITGASTVEQLRSNLGALDVLPLITSEVAARLDAISAPT
jgi:voltage-dependent potassium channel beta subunit